MAHCHPDPGTVVKLLAGFSSSFMKKVLEDRDCVLVATVFSGLEHGLMSCA